MLSKTLSLLKMANWLVENLAVEIPWRNVLSDPLFVILDEDCRFVDLDDQSPRYAVVKEEPR